VTRRVLPPTWRAGLAIILVAVVAAILWSLNPPAASEPAPSFTPVQLPTLEVEP